MSALSGRRGFIGTLCALFAGAFLLVFVPVAAAAVLIPYPYAHFPLLTCAVFLGTGVVLFLAYRRLSRVSGFLERRFGVLLLLFSLLMLTAQLALGAHLRFQPAFDLEALYQGALEWLETGSFGAYASSTCHADYFAIFPNNLGGLVFLTLLFRPAAALGITDWFGVAMTANAVLVVSSMVLTALSCRRLWGAPTAITACLLFALSPPFWFMAPVFYTDTLSMVFPAAVFYLYVCSRAETRRIRLALYYAGMGILAALGALLKATVLIILIAILIALLCEKRWRRAMALAGAALCLIPLLFAGFRAYTAAHQQTSSAAAQESMPLSYWLALAVQGEGTYNHAIFQLGRSIRNPAARDAALREQVLAGLREQGIGGALTLPIRKSVRAFSDGTFALSDFLDDTPLTPNGLHRFLLYKGEYHPLYQSLCNGVWGVVLLLLLLSLWLHGKNGQPCAVFAAQVALFGLWLFLMLWEVNSRYITNFLSLLYLCAAGGMKPFSHFVRRTLHRLHVRCLPPHIVSGGDIAEAAHRTSCENSVKNKTGHKIRCAPRWSVHRLRCFPAVSRRCSTGNSSRTTTALRRSPA